jgi:NADH pyrophosphatase NudC (nudix superfamily)
VNLGEEFGVAAQREVFEETNIETKFDRVVALRHSHKQQFGRSNLYVLCLLEALSTQINRDSEVVEAKWESILKFRHEYPLSPLTAYVTDLVIDSLNSTNENFQKFQEKQIPLMDGKTTYTLYH